MLGTVLPLLSYALFVICELWLWLTIIERDDEEVSDEIMERFTSLLERNSVHFRQEQPQKTEATVASQPVNIPVPREGPVQHMPDRPVNTVPTLHRRPSKGCKHRSRISVIRTLKQEVVTQFGGITGFGAPTAPQQSRIPDPGPLNLDPGVVHPTAFHGASAPSQASGPETYASISNANSMGQQSRVSQQSRTSYAPIAGQHNQHTGSQLQQTGQYGQQLVDQTIQDARGMRQEMGTHGPQHAGQHNQNASSLRQEVRGYGELLVNQQSQSGEGHYEAVPEADSSMTALSARQGLHQQGAVPHSEHEGEAGAQGADHIPAEEASRSGSLFTADIYRMSGASTRSDGVDLHEGQATGGAGYVPAQRRDGSGSQVFKGVSRNILKPMYNSVLRPLGKKVQSAMASDGDQTPRPPKRRLHPKFVRYYDVWDNSVRNAGFLTAFWCVNVVEYNIRKWTLFIACTVFLFTVLVVPHVTRFAQQITLPQAPAQMLVGQ